MSQRSTTTKPNRRTEFLRPVRVTTEELETVQQKANDAGVTLSEYQRRMCLSGKVVVQETAADVEAIRQLLAVGRNLNQLVKSGHINKAVNEAELTRTLQRINEAVDGLLS